MASVTFFDPDQAQQLLDAINAYLWIIEYEYDTTLQWIIDTIAGEGMEMAIGKIVEMAGVSEAIAGWIATFVSSGYEEAQEEALKTLRRFRDDLGDAIEAWRDNINDEEIQHMSIYIGTTMLDPDYYRISVESSPQDSLYNTVIYLKDEHTGGPLWGDE